jgi:hypothetical protein
VNWVYKMADERKWRIMSLVVEQGVARVSAEAGAGDQRRWLRTECAHELVIHLVREGMVGEAVVTRSGDFSTMGLGLIHSEAMEKGEQFLVPLKTRSGPPLPLLYAVVHCRAMGDGQYQIGAELVSVFNLEAFGKRRSGETVAECIAEGVGGDAIQKDE